MKCNEADCGGESCTCRKPAMAPDTAVNLMWLRYQENRATKPGLTDLEAFTAAVAPVVLSASGFVDLGKLLEPVAMEETK